MKIRVCIPFYSEFGSAKPGLLELKSCKEHEFIIEPRQGTLICELRNDLINDGKSHLKFQQPVNGFDAFLDIDSDISFTLKDVLLLINHNKDIVSLPYLIHGSNSVYQCGEFDSIPGNISKRYTTSEKGLKRVGWTGNGMRLTRARCFQKMEYPWYRHIMVKHGDNQKESSEDVGFSMMAKKAGYNIWCDFYRPVKHKNRTAYDFDWNIT